MLEEIILQFVRGEIDFSLFYDEYCKDNKIIQCLENTVSFLCKKNIPVTYDAVFRENFSSEEAEYYIQKNRMDHTDIVVPNKNYSTVKSLIDHFINSNCSFLMKKSEIYDLIFSIVVALEPDTIYYHKYSNDFKFFICVVPDYVAGSKDSCDYIEKEIIAKIPYNLSETKRKKLCKEQVKQNFHIEGNKYPRWAQSAEWPIANGKPARYLGYKRTGDLVVYTFENDVTGDLITVEQYY